MSIHSEDPFAVPVEQRDPVRRLRGRLATPVTILTAGETRPAGLTVSSVLIVEGAPPRTAVLVGAGADLVDAVEETKRFLVQVLEAGNETVADVFAGRRPSPGGMFRSVETQSTQWGPLIDGVENWAGCCLEEIRPLGDQLLIVGEIEDLHVGELDDPLVYFRGMYRRLRP